MKPARARYRKIDERVNEILDKDSYCRPPVDIMSIARGAGLQIRMNDLADLSVVLRRDSRSATVVLNRAENSLRHRFAVAHALGHILLHPELDQHADAQFTVLGRNRQLSYDRSIQEKEANYFAACILVPERSLKDEIGSCPRDEFGEIDVHQLAKAYIVSSNLMLLRLCGMENQFQTIPIFNTR